MKWAVIVARGFLGLVFVVFGVNAFLNFIEMPPQPEPVASFTKIMYIDSHYLHVVKALEIVCALMLLSGKFVPLSLSILTPIAVNILLFEVFIAGTPGPGGVLLALCIFLIFAYRSYFFPLFTADARIGG